MIGAWVRNAVLALAIVLWVSLAWDLNTDFAAWFSRYNSVEQIVYYLLTPAVVIAASLLALVLRWGRRFADADVVLAAAPVLFLPIYLLPLQ